jgi:hypothetical protein
VGAELHRHARGGGADPVGQQAGPQPAGVARGRDLRVVDLVRQVEGADRGVTGRFWWPLMLMVTRVGIERRPASAAMRATSTSAATRSASTIIAAGRKSSVRAKNRTTSKPRARMCAMSSRTSPRSSSFHIHMALRRGQ